MKVAALTVPQFGIGNDSHSAHLAFSWKDSVLDNGLLACPTCVGNRPNNSVIPIECLGLVVTTIACASYSGLKNFVSLLQMLKLC